MQHQELMDRLGKLEQTLGELRGDVQHDAFVSQRSQQSEESAIQESALFILSRLERRIDGLEALLRKLAEKIDRAFEPRLVLQPHALAEELVPKNPDLPLPRRRWSTSRKRRAK